MHEISDQVLEESDRLTQAVLQTADMLGMYRAELARVLNLYCGDIGELAAIRQSLQPGTAAWQQAVLFIRFYQALYSVMEGDEVAMCHWLRAENKHLKGAPLLLMVDEGRLSDVLDYAENRLRFERRSSGPGL